MSSPQDSKSGSDDSDLVWFEALSGRTASDDTSPAAREGFAMRAALELHLREIDADPELIAATSDAAAERMRARILAEGRKEQDDTGLVPPAEAGPRRPAQSNNVVEFPWWRRRKVYAALAASVVLGLVVSQQIEIQADYPPPVTFRGDPTAQQRVRAAHPREAAERLTEQLKTVGLRPGLFQQAKVYIVDVDLKADQLTMVQPVFDELRIKPAPGFNRIEIGPP